MCRRPQEQNPSDQTLGRVLAASDTYRGASHKKGYVSRHIALLGPSFRLRNRQRTMIKVLYWDRNGFCLWQKRLEKHRFAWPESRREVMELGPRELSFLLEGLDIGSLKPHEELQYSSMI